MPGSGSWDESAHGTEKIYIWCAASCSVGVAQRQRQTYMTLPSLQGCGRVDDTLGGDIVLARHVKTQMQHMQRCMTTANVGFENELTTQANIY